MNIVLGSKERSMPIKPDIFEKTLLVLLHLTHDFIESVFRIAGFGQLICLLDFNLRKCFFRAIHQELQMIGQSDDFLGHLEGFKSQFLQKVHLDLMPPLEFGQSLQKITLTTLLKEVPETSGVVGMESHFLGEFFVRDLNTLGL